MHVGCRQALRWSWAFALCAVLALDGSASAQQDRGLGDDDAQDREESPPPDQAGIFYTTAEDRMQSLDVYLPAEPGDRRPAVIFVHGGGFRRGTKNTFRLEGESARQRGWVGFSINYRLDEDPGHPAEMTDVLSAVEWVRENAHDFGVDPSRIALWGTSAGASLAALSAVTATGPLDAGNRVMAVVAFSGPMELVAVHSARNAATVEAYLGCSPSECPDLYADASATSHVTADDPPMFLAHSQDEGIPVEVSEQLAALLASAGVDVDLVVVPGALHARSLSLRTPGLMDDAFDFLEDRFSTFTGGTTTNPPASTSVPDGSTDTGPSIPPETPDTESTTTITAPDDRGNDGVSGWWFALGGALIGVMGGAAIARSRR